MGGLGELAATMVVEPSRDEGGSPELEKMMAVVGARVCRGEVVADGGGEGAGIREEKICSTFCPLFLATKIVCFSLRLICLADKP
jgi:hypothetical protein